MKAGTIPGDPRDLRRGAERLEAELQGLEEALEKRQSEFFRSLERSLVEPMRAAFAGARDAHRELGRETGLLPGDGPTDSLEVDGTRLSRYREGVRVQVLEPLWTALQEMEIGEEVWRRWQGFRDGLPSLADSLPPLLYREEPEDLYGPRADDGRVTAVRKGLIRGWRALRQAPSRLWRGILKMAGREVEDPPPRAQPVPLQSLARSCFLGRCPFRLELLSEGLQQHFARPVAILEAAIVDWTDSWFPAEEAVRTAEGHLGTRFLEEISRDLPSPVDPADPDLPQEEEASAPPGDESPGEPSLDPTLLPEICGALQEVLDTVSALDPPSDVRNQTREAMTLEWEELLEDIRVAGSFQAAGRPRQGPKRVARLLERRAARAESWESWHRNGLERLHLSILLLRLRETLATSENQFMGRVVEEALAPLVDSWRNARTTLQDLEEEAARIFPEGGGRVDPRVMARDIEALRVRAETVAGADLKATFRATNPTQTVQQVGDQVAGDLSDNLRFLPESISVPPHQDTGDRIVPTTTVRHVPFREMVLQTVDVLRLEALRNSSRPLLEFLETASEECEEIPNVVSFNLTAARDELATPPEGDLAPILDDARSMTVDGLTRTAQGLEGLLRGLAPPWREFTREADDLIWTSFREIHTRAMAEGAVQEQMLDLRAQLRAWIRKGGDRGREWSRRAAGRASRLLRRWRIRGEKLVHLGRAAVGTPSAQEGEAERAMDTLRGIPQLLESLPLVYRRLYSFQPVTDPNLLVGREEETDWVNRRLEAWKGGRGVPCLLTGPVGVGHTSFLNVLAATKLEGYRVFRVTLHGRIGTEERLAGLLAESLEVGGDGPWTFPHLLRHLLEDHAFDRPSAVLLEHLEHLFLRVPGGTDLLERFISLQAQTASRVFWLSNTSGASWKVLEKSEPRAAPLLAQHPVSTLSRPDLERVVMSRHRRSGLPVEFLQPGDSNPLLRRRLRRARGEKSKQEIIREDFFDRVFRMSDGNIAMALLLWLRSTDFTSREGWLRVRAPRPIRFAFLEELDLAMDFALKGFLEHGSLTLEEYGRVFGVGPDEAFQVLESLRARMLLESMGTRGGGSPSVDQGVREGERYRIPGILSQVVAHRLRNRNILH